MKEKTLLEKFNLKKELKRFELLSLFLSFYIVFLIEVLNVHSLVDSCLRLVLKSVSLSPTSSPHFIPPLLPLGGFLLAYYFCIYLHVLNSILVF